jgi:hypothetical protein
MGQHIGKTGIKGYYMGMAGSLQLAVCGAVVGHVEINCSKTITKL